MSRAREWVIIGLVALTAGGAGYAYNAWWTGGDTGTTATAVETLNRTRLPDLEGTVRPLSEWKGKVVVVNFWATWCAPCREEIPLFVKLQKKYGERGLQFVGIAIDQADKVRPYAAELGMNFPILLGGADAIELTRSLGNRAGVLPYTVILDRDGKVVSKEVGAAKEARLEPLLSGLL